MTPERKTLSAKLVPLDRVDWFDLLWKEGAIDRWLDSATEADFQYALTLICQPSIVAARDEQVSAWMRQLLTEPERTGFSPRAQVIRLLPMVQHRAGPALVDLLLSAIKEGLYDDRKQEWWRQFYSLPDHHPKRAIDLVAVVFDRFLRDQIAKPRQWGADGELPRLDHDIMLRAAQKEPLYFAETMLPRLINVVQAALGDPPIETDLTIDPIWPFFALGMNDGGKDELLTSVTLALSSLSKEKPAELDQLTTGMDPVVSRTFAFILLLAWSENPKCYSARLITTLLSRPTLLDLGYAVMSDGNGTAWISRKAVEAATHHCTEAELRQLEEAILRFHPSDERSEPRRYGYTQALLLHAIDPQRISDKARAKQEQWDRKFPEIDLSAPEGGIRGGFVPSPISEDKAAKMTDANWIRAMLQYHDQKAADPAKWILGGAHELAQVLERKVRRNKDRFARLVLQMGEQISLIYFDAILRGLVAREDDQKEDGSPGKCPLPPAQPELLNEVFRKVHSVLKGRDGRWLVSSIGAVSKNPLPEDVLEIVCHSAQRAKDPEKAGNPGNRFFNGSLVNIGINTTRGSAANALAKLLFSEPVRWPKLKRAILAGVKDPAWSVRATAVEGLTALLNVDRDLAVRLFLEHYADNEALLASMMVPEFLRHAVVSHYAELRPIIERMFVMENPGLQKMAATAVCQASFRYQQAEADMSWIRSGSMAARQAWAEGAVLNLGHRQSAERCRRWLIECFQDPDETVRQTAAGCFSRISSEQLCQETELIDQFIDSPAFKSEATWLIYSLEEAVHRLPGVVCRVAEKLVELYRQGDAGDPHRFFPHQVITLVLRLYHQTRDEPIKKRCLDVIDAMMEFDIGTVASELTKMERV